MVSRVDPSVKVAKAAEFLEVAEVALATEHYDTAVSLSVSAAINMTDALCLHALGRYSKALGHEDAVILAGKVGITGRGVAVQLRRLLSVKDKAQYANARCSPQEAQDAFRRATRVFGVIQRVLDAT